MANAAYSAKNLAPSVEASALIVAVLKKKDRGWLFGDCRPRGPERREHEKKSVTLVYSVMSYLKSHWPAGDVYLSCARKAWSRRRW